ncbi:MAG TPA: hypothetical protein PKV13_08575 [Propionicimonas sp.]|nr:hypothetical protein [Propionicimonas sp.]HRA06658.1 hypothetical protein [Propionicimonas sp.]
MGRTAVVGAAAVLLLSGCVMVEDVNDRPPLQTTSSLPSATPTAGTDAVPSPMQWDAILSDLAARGVSTDDVRLVSSRTVTWNDGSLGCPKPGSTYTQALVLGMQVIVAVAEVQYDYRFGRSVTPVLCERA